MFAGLPSITSDCGGMKSIYGDNAIIIEMYDFKDLANQIFNLAQNESLICEMSKNGNQFIKRNFTIDVIVKKWENILLK